MNAKYCFCNVTVYEENVVWAITITKLHMHLPKQATTKIRENQLKETRRLEKISLGHSTFGYVHLKMN